MNLTTVTLVSGIPATGTGTVSTLDALLAVLPAALASNGGLKIEGVASGVAVPISVASLPSHAVTNAGTFAVQAAAILAAETTKVIGTINISAAQTIAAVTAITNALPAGTNAIGKLAANSGVDIGDVDVTSVPADPFGTNADAASVSTSISAKLKAIATALGTVALTRGQGAGDSNTLRVTVDNSQTDGSEYAPVAVSQTAQAIGAGGGAIGDYMSHVIVSTATAGCGVVTIYDNATIIAAFPGGGTTPLTSLQPFIIPIGITSTSGAWKITTGANVTCTAVGNFT